ncbi:hypothetical protein [Branchiibius cervicis]|uniref:ArsR family transcriptional regulator n=1 Tax=Branchiibius cervicis TaxID=908252 RepID=A0ABW2AWB6_9MICO
MLDHAEMGDVRALAVLLRTMGNPDRLGVLAAVVEPCTVPELRANPALPASPQNHLEALEYIGLVVQHPGVAPRAWQQIPGAVERVSRLVQSLGA